MPSREDLTIAISAQDNTAQAFRSLKNNAQASQGAVNQLGGALAGLSAGNITGLLSLPGSLSGLAGTAGALTAILAPIAAIAYLAGKVKDTAMEFRDYAKSVKDAADQSELGIGPTQALIVLFQQHGVEADRAAQFMNKFAVAHANAAKGEGDLYKEMFRTNSALADQFALTTNTSAAFAVFLKALMGADAETQRLFLNAAGGRGSGALLQAFKDLAGRGGLGAVTAGMTDLGLVIDKNVIEKTNDAAVAAQLKARQVSNAWGQAANSIYEDWRNFKKSIGLGDNNEIKVAMSIKAQFEGADGTLLGVLMKGIAGGAPLAVPLAVRMAPSGGIDPAATERRLLNSLSGTRDSNLQEGATPRSAITPLPMPPVRPSQKEIDDDDLKRLRLAIEPEKQRLALLGDLAGSTEILKAKEGELTIIRKSGIKISDDEAALIKENNRVKLQGAQLQLRAQLGLADAAGQFNQKQDELNVLLRAGKISQDDYNVALQVAARASKEFGNQQAVLRSQFPELTRLQQEFSDARKLADQAGTAISNNLVTGFADILDGTKSAAQGFADLGKTVARTIEEMILKMTVGRLAAQALNSALTAVGIGVPSVPGMPLNLVPASVATGHTGAMIGQGVGSRSVSPMMFAGAPRMHTGGLLTDEIPFIGKRGEEIGWPGDMARKYGGGGSGMNVSVNLIQDSSKAGQVSDARHDGAGGMQIDAYVDSIFASKFATPGSKSSNAARAQYGLRPALTRR